MISASDNIIYLIIRKRAYDLLRPELIDYFDGLQRHLYESCFMTRLRKVDPTIETVTNYINTQSDIKTTKEKHAVISHLHSITTGMRYIDSSEVEDLLELEWKNTNNMNLVRVLTDPTATSEMKSAMITKTAEILNRTRKQEDFASVKKLLQKFRDEYNIESASDFTNSLIKLEDDNLKMLFDSTIYPHMYSILGRPGDFKTTLVLQLMLEFNRLKKPGILISLEDSSIMASFKLLSMMTGINKSTIIKHQYDPKIYDGEVASMNDNIYVMDKMRTGGELFVDLKNKLSSGDWKWIAIDYLQCIKGEKYQSDYEKINTLDRHMMELNKEFQIPIFRLSQTDKASMAGSGKLGMGSEKGSGEIAHNSRYAIAINQPSGGSDEGREYVTRHINVYKTTFCAKGTYEVKFHGATGRIDSVNKLGEPE